MLSRSLLRFAPQGKTLVQATRNMTVYSAPPSVRISWSEKVGLGMLMTLSYMIIPAWVLCNLKHYRARD